MNSTTKFYVLVREDLGASGHQLAQAGHAMLDFALTHDLREWREKSNRLVVLSVQNEQAIFAIWQQCLRKGILTSVFCEPDKHYQATALAIDPRADLQAAGIDLSSLSLAAKYNMPWLCNPKLQDLIFKMRSCNQTDNQSIMEHGLSVHKQAFKIIEALYFPRILKDLHPFLPPQLLKSKNFRKHIKDNLYPLETIWDYTIFHDCGKPSCIQVDENGQRHFPEHNLISAQTWEEVTGDLVVSSLMHEDMTLHRMKAAEWADYIQDIHPAEICTLLVVAYASIAANAIDHDPQGIHGERYKIARKKLDRFTKRYYQSLGFSTS